jgi:hypothetical protein
VPGATAGRSAAGPDPAAGRATIGSSGSTRSGTGDAFDVLLRNAGIGAAMTMAPDARVVWP